MTMSARSSRTARPSSTRCIRASVILAFSSPARSRRKEHGEFVSCMEMIDALPPGLYEAVITEVDENTANRNLVEGKYLFRLEARTLDHIRALGTNDAAEDDTRFATVARVSEINLGLYESTFWLPCIRMSMTEPMAEASRAMHPNRLRFAMFSDQNPFMAPVKATGRSRCVRRGSPSVPTIRCWPWSRQLHRGSRPACKAVASCATSMTEAVFLNTYGSPWLQALVGLGGPQTAPHRIERDLVREADVARLRAELEKQFEDGGMTEAAMRALIYIRLPEGSIDERGFSVLKMIRASRPADKRMTLAQFKEMVQATVSVGLPGSRSARSAACRSCSAAMPDARKAALDMLRSGARGARRDVRRGQAPSEADRGDVRDGGHEAKQGRGGTCLKSTGQDVPHDKYERLIEAAQALAAIKVAIAHPCDEVSLQGAVEAARLRLIEPILVGPVGTHSRASPSARGLDIGAMEIVDFGAQPRLRRQGGRAGDGRHGSRR